VKYIVHNSQNQYNTDLYRVYSKQGELGRGVIFTLYFLFTQDKATQSYLSMILCHHPY